MMRTSLRTTLRSAAIALALASIACGTRGDGSLQLPADSTVVVRLDEPIDSNGARAGQVLAAVIEVPVEHEGVQILAAGIPATVEIVEAHPARDEALARMTLELGTLTIGDRTVDVEASPLRLVGHTWTDLGERDEAPSGLAGRTAGGVESAKAGGVLGATASAVIAVDTEDDAISLGKGQTLLFHTRADVTLPTP